MSVEVQRSALGGRLFRFAKAGIVLSLLCLLFGIVAEVGQYSPTAQAIGAVSIAASLVHCFIAFGWRDTAAFAAICLVVTFTFENIGVASGFPFGRYQFELHHLPRIGQIPIIVGPLYMGMGYLSWVIANLIFAGVVRRPQDRLHLVALPLLATFIMTQWDAVMDPGGSTLARAWTWHSGGGYFGVPLSNFLGWLFVNGVYFALFSLYLYRRGAVALAPRSIWFWSVPVLLYLASGLSQIVPFLLDASQSLVDPSGRSWQSADLRETAVIVMLVTMMPSSLIALLRLVEVSKH